MNMHMGLESDLLLCTQILSNLTGPPRPDLDRRAPCKPEPVLAAVEWQGVIGLGCCGTGVNTAVACPCHQQATPTGLQSLDFVSEFQLHLSKPKLPGSGGHASQVSAQIQSTGPDIVSPYLKQCLQTPNLSQICT